MLDHFLISVVITWYFPLSLGAKGSQLVDLVNNYYSRIAGAGTTVASYPGPYTRGVRASFQGGIRAWYPLSYAYTRFSQKSVK